MKTTTKTREIYVQIVGDTVCTEDGIHAVRDSFTNSEYSNAMVKYIDFCPSTNANSAAETNHVILTR